MLIAPAVAKDKVVTVSAIWPMTTDHPYGESSGPVYSLWCQVYGCLGRWDYEKGEGVGILVEKWELVEPLKWRFTLKTGLKRHDGGPGPTSADVVHSLDRIRNDRESVHRSFIRNVKDITVVDERTFDVNTKTPAVNLIVALFDRFIITSKELYEKHGREADKKYPFGWGPYKLEEYSPDRRVVLRKSPVWQHDDKAPDVVVMRQMREAEQRVTALLNGEIQIATPIPPQLMQRVEKRDDIKLASVGSHEIMFVAFNVNMDPWKDKRLRKAAAHAINRPLIMERLLRGLAEPIDGMIGPNQYCYLGKHEQNNAYDPAKAKALLAEAGFKDGGPEIDFYTANGRYISDRQVGEVVAQMLKQVGFKVTLHAPEYANFWANVRKGKTPMFYMGRGSVYDAADAMGQFFGTGGSPRVQYSNPKFDEILKAQYAEGDKAKRCELFRQLNQIIIDDVPAHHMWTHKIVTGVRKGVDVYVPPTSEFWFADARMN